ncbi:hypothetical protein IYY11_11920 [Methylocystis sp. H62]|uniref:hypothetical protein n=1 Tax=Methylocystis sp. H62 TaxID=2785789 RepID=UPI0018C2AE35|nr:hypothetical protein [Methylocystis sp. H62]MBG0794075.1 hypothetical protein [Methylocystis sp. H62]
MRESLPTAVRSNSASQVQTTRALAKARWWFSMPGIKITRQRRSRQTVGVAPSHHGEVRLTEEVSRIDTPLASVEWFETVADSAREDKHRIKAINYSLPLNGAPDWVDLKVRRAVWQIKHRVLHLPPPPIDADAANSLLQKLQSNVAEESFEPTLASSLSMRRTRKKVIGALLRALEHIPDADLRAFTVLNRNWVFTPEQLNSISASTLKNRFRTHLKRAGVLDLPGVFIAFLHGEFEPSAGVYVIHFHGVSTAEKAEALRGLKSQPGYVQSATGAAPIKIQRVNDRVTQFTYLLKSFWPQKAVRRCSDGEERRDRHGSRIPGLFQTQYLVWLNQQSLGDITILSDAWSRRNGGSPAMRELYLSIYQRRVDE